MPEEAPRKTIRLPASTGVLLALVLVGMILPFALSFRSGGLIHPAHPIARTPAQRAAFEQIKSLQKDFRAAYDDANSGNRIKKYWYNSVTIPPEVIVVDYGEKRPTLELLENSRLSHLPIPVYYRIPDDNPDWAVVQYVSLSQSLHAIELERLAEEIAAARAMFSDKDAAAGVPSAPATAQEQMPVQISKEYD